MSKPIYLVCGVPGSGKTWCCEQLDGKFNYVPHDDYLVSQYTDALIKRAEYSDRPVLGECPFRISILISDLRKAGMQVHPYFIVEDPETVKKRYQLRERKPIPKQHITRMKTIRERAAAYGTGIGTSQQILEMLRQI
jgi:hypothetical protein